MVKAKTTSDVTDGFTTDSENENDKNNDEKGTSSCPHIAKAADPSRLRKVLKGTSFQTKCSECDKNPSENLPPAEESELCAEYYGPLWLCLKCGTQLCGRARRQHAKAHFEVSSVNNRSNGMNE